MTVDTGLTPAELGELREQVDPTIAAARAERERRMMLQRAIHALPFPSVTFLVSAGALTQSPTQVLLGPDDGQVWDIRLVTLAGWTTADAAINVNLYTESLLGAAGSQGNPQNRLAKFNDSAPGAERWAPSGGLVMHSPEQLLITGSGFTTTTAITLNLRGVALEQWLEPDYLL